MVCAIADARRHTHKPQQTSSNLTRSQRNQVMCTRTTRVTMTALEICTRHMPMGTQAAKLNPEAKAPHSPTGKERAVGGVNLLLQKLGPGLITGASDDDPSGIGTYSQLGA